MKEILFLFPLTEKNEFYTKLMGKKKEPCQIAPQTEVLWAEMFGCTTFLPFHSFLRIITKDHKGLIDIICIKCD